MSAVAALYPSSRSFSEQLALEIRNRLCNDEPSAPKNLGTERSRIVVLTGTRWRMVQLTIRKIVMTVDAAERGSYAVIQFPVVLAPGQSPEDLGEDALLGVSLPPSTSRPLQQLGKHQQNKCLSAAASIQNVEDRWIAPKTCQSANVGHSGRSPTHW